MSRQGAQRYTTGVAPKPAAIIDRDREWAQLERMATSERPELVFVLGRRRVGKSFLLAPFAAVEQGIYYQASRRSEAEQLAALTRLLGERFGDPALEHGAAVSDWDALLGYLKGKAGAAPLVVVLDEYPYLEECAPGLSSILQRWWDHELAGTRMKVVLAGSYISAMKRLDDPDQPLHARRTAGLNLRPFDPFDALAFHPHLDPKSAIEMWAIFGGLPGQLALLDQSRPLTENIIDHILTPTSRLFDEGQGLLDGLVEEPGLHHSILASVTAGEHTLRGITKRTGKSSDALGRPLQWLIDMELLERALPLTETNPRSSKRARYRVADPYLLFWHRFVSPLAQAGLAITAAPEALWRARIAPQIDDYMGPMFERACRAWLSRAKDLPIDVAEVGTWWDDSHEIDVVARSLDGRSILAAECKWGTVDAHDEARLERSAEVLRRVLDASGPSSGHTPHEIHLALFAGRGSDGQNPPKRVTVLTPEEMFGRVGPSPAS